MIVYILMAASIFFDWDSYIVLAVHTLVLLLILLNVAIYGDANFRDLKMVGDYQVGH